MNCTNCGNEIKDGAKFCTACGSVIEATVEEPVVVLAEPTQQSTKQQNKIPEKYSPLSPWAYFGLQLLFAVPVVGFIFLIIFSFKKSNINRRNFARSYWCKLIIVVGVMIVALVIALILGVSIGSLLRMDSLGGMGAEMAVL